MNKRMERFLLEKKQKKIRIYCVLICIVVLITGIGAAQLSFDSMLGEGNSKIAQVTSNDKGVYTFKIFDYSTSIDFGSIVTMGQKSFDAAKVFLTKQVNDK